LIFFEPSVILYLKTKGGIKMLKKYLSSIVVIMLFTSAGFASIGQHAGHTLITFCHPVFVGHSQIVHSFCFGTVGFVQQTCIVNCQHQVSHHFYCWPYELQWKHHCQSPCEQQSSQTYILNGGDATSTTVSYGDGADSIAQAVGGNAGLEVQSSPSSNPSCNVKGGDATASATSYGEGAAASAYAVGGDAVVVIK
jgi:hypothetical protein